MRRAARAAALLAAALLAAASADAHSRSQSFSTWSVNDGDVRVSYSLLAREATRLPVIEGNLADLDALLVSHLGPRLRVSADGAPCRRVAGPTALAAASGHLRAELRFDCGDARELLLQNDAFFELVPSHVHFARVRAAGRPPIEYLFTDTQRVRVIAPHADAADPQAGGSTLGAYVALGVAHILSGVDHIAFLIALIVLSPALREVALIVTGFTLGHSITLSLAVLGLVRPEPGVVEALIGFTIALVAAENIGVAFGDNRAIARCGGAALLGLALLGLATGAGPPLVTLAGLAVFTFCYLTLAETPAAARRYRPAVTALFGMVHGFGFASVLLEVGIPQQRLLAGLFGFNLGVELGQLAIVACLLALGALLLRRLPLDRRFATDACSAGLVALGLYWFVGRAYFSAC